MTRIKLLAGLIFLASTGLATNTFGQFTSASGGRAVGMANTAILLADEYALFNNPGSLKTESLSFQSSFNTYYLGLGINDVQIGLTLPLKDFNTGLGVKYFGDKLYNQLNVSTAASHNIGFADLGIRVNYNQFYLENYGYKRNISIDIGGSFQLSKELRLGMLITNLFRARLEGQDQYRLSSLIALGLSYQPIDAFRIDFQLNKDINLPVAGSIGLEYMITTAIYARTGFEITNSIAGLGLGFQWRGFRLDVGGQYQPRLGYSGAISIIIEKQGDE